MEKRGEKKMGTRGEGKRERKGERVGETNKGVGDCVHCTGGIDMLAQTATVRGDMGQCTSDPVSAVRTQRRCQ